MSKAEERVEEYCHSTLVGSSYIKKMAYIQGYHQAEKDLLANKHEKSWRLDEKLWKGIKDVEEASYQYTYDASNDWAYDIPTWDDVQDAFKAGSEWKEGLELTWKAMREQLWVDADSDNLPPIDKDVIALEGLGDGDYKVVFAHRISPDSVIRTSIDGKPMELHPKRYGKAGWNLPDIKYWLNVELPRVW